MDNSGDKVFRLTLAAERKEPETTPIPQGPLSDPDTFILREDPPREEEEEDHADDSGSHSAKAVEGDEEEKEDGGHEDSSSQGHHSLSLSLSSGTPIGVVLTAFPPCFGMPSCRLFGLPS